MAEDKKNPKAGEPNEKENKGQKSFRNNLFKTVKSISEKFSLLVGTSSDSLREVRKQTRDLSLQVKLTKKQIKENRFRLDKIAESNTAVAEALKDYDNVNFQAIEQVEELLAQNKEIPAELGKQYKEAIELLNKSLKPLEKQEGFMVNLGSVMEEVAKIVADRSIAPDTRKSYVTDFIKLLAKNQYQMSTEMKQLYDLLLDEAKRGLKMEDSQTDDIGAIFELMKTYKIEDMKTQGSIESINHIAGKLLMSSRNIEDKIDQNQLDVKDLLERLEKGLDSEGMDLGDLIFAALGIPGLLKSVKSLAGFGKKAFTSLKDIFGEKGFIKNMIKKVGDGWKKIGKKMKPILNVFGKNGFIGKIIGKIGGFASKVGGVFKSIGSFFGKIAKVFKPIMKVVGTVGKGATAFLGPVAAIIGAVLGIFDAVSGFFDADKISGKAEEMVTLGDRIQAAISGFLSGLSLGFISAETIFKKIDEAQEFISNLWDDTGKVFDDFVDTITEFFNSDDGFMGTIKKIAKKFTDFKVSKLMPDWLADAVGMDKSEDIEEAVGQEPSRFSSSPAKTEPVLNTLTPAKMRMQSEDKMPSEQLTQAFHKEEKVRNTAKGKAMAKAIPIPVSQGQQAPQRGAVRKVQVDDTQLAVLNLGMMD